MLDVVRTQTADQINLCSTILRMVCLGHFFSTVALSIFQMKWSDWKQDSKLLWRPWRAGSLEIKACPSTLQSHLAKGPYELCWTWWVYGNGICQEMYTVLCSVQVLIHGALFILREVPLSLRDSPHTVRELNMDVWKWFHHLKYSCSEDPTVQGRLKTLPCSLWHQQGSQRRNQVLFFLLQNTSLY